MSNHRPYQLISGYFLQLICYVSCIASVSAQQPAYFILGKEELNGLQIYDITQDRQQNYLFATNNGIYYFNYHTYSKIECDEAKSSSVFKFVTDKNDNIYCHNLNNQIFRIHKRTCSLFYELKKDEARADISLTVDNDGNIIIGAGKIIILHNNGSVISCIPLNGHFLGPVFTKPDKDMLFHLSNSDSIITCSKGKISFERLNFRSGNLPDESVLKFFTVGKSSYAFEQKTKLLFNYNVTKNELVTLRKNELPQIEGAIRIYETGNEVWVAGTFPGITVFNKRMDKFQGSPFYNDHFISNVFKDAEGNILLSTFDDGIVVIPDMNIPDAVNFLENDRVISLYTDQANQLFMGSSKGQFISYSEGKMKIMSDGGNHPVEGIYGSDKSDLLIFDNGYIRLYNKKTGTVKDLNGLSLKDAAVVSNEEVYLGTNRGIIKVEPNNTQPHFSSPIAGLSQRIYSVEYNSLNKNIYTSTADGLFVLFPSGKTEKIEFSGLDLFPTSLHYSNGKIFATTHKYGILIVEDRKVTGRIQPTIDGKPEDLKKIIIYENTIIGKSINGLFRFDMNGSLISSLHSTYRIKSKHIIDFNIKNNALWICHSGGVQLVTLNYSLPDSSLPDIRFDEILVNDQSLDSFQKSNFKNDQRKIKFVFSSPTLRNMGNINYYYRLMGYDNDWKTQSYNGNEITFNALAPGSYTLELRAENQGRFSKTISYSFTIQKPFYTNWWFIIMMLVLFLVIVYLIYRWQLNIQNKKAKQLNELNVSKLTAIQSQMNPHFIFNSLNSIQDLILKGDVEHSYSYITTFSNLVRRTLNYSDKDFIEFEQELKLLELYLSLEKLRYKKDLHYNIVVKNVEDIMIPPLLIQPFIENSLVHGLLHKEGEKKLTITFELKQALICTIEDNGIGREQAKTIKQRQRSDHESFSGKAILKRFEILSNVFKGEFGYVYEDLYENKKATGTKVILTIPVKWKF